MFEIAGWPVETFCYSFSKPKAHHADSKNNNYQLTWAAVYFFSAMCDRKGWTPLALLLQSQPSPVFLLCTFSEQNLTNFHLLLSPWKLTLGALSSDNSAICSSHIQLIADSQYPFVPTATSQYATSALITGLHQKLSPQKGPETNIKRHRFKGSCMCSFLGHGSKPSLKKLKQIYKKCWMVAALYHLFCSGLERNCINPWCSIYHLSFITATK